jgi:hypothetical protein
LADPISVGRDFFETIGISAVSGRLFQAQDHTIESESVAIVDEAAVSRWWPDQDPLGQRIRMGSEEADWMTVVGVVENVTFDAPGEYWPHVYTPHNPSARTHPFVTLATFLTVRAERADAPVSSQIRSLTRTLDPGLAVANEFSMETILSRAAARSRFVMSVLSVFALVAVVLGAIGIYGVISYSVALRVREIGIRRALGAGGGAVVMMIQRQGMVLALTGVGLGLAGAFAGTRLLEGFLHDVEATDPFTYALVGLGTLLVASAATYLPARGAGGVDPLEALRIE